MDRLFYRRKEVAEQLGISVKTVDRYIISGRIRASKQAHMVLIHAESVTKENILSIKPKFKNKL